METTERQQIRLVHDTKSEYASLNDMLARKKILEDELASLVQQVAGVQRKITLIDQEFHKAVITARPSVVMGPPTTRQRKPNQTQQILDAIKNNPQLMSKLADMIEMDL